MATCLIALGANLGDRRATLDQAVVRLRACAEISGVAPSDWIATRPVGGPAGQDEFLNGAVRLETRLAPKSLLARLRDIERDLGRVPGARWSARTLDLDLLLYDRRVIDTPTLVVPHPRMSFRRFVLVPAVQVAADMVHPTSGWTLARLLTHLETAADFVAIAGPAGAGKTWLAKRLCARFHGRLLTQPKVSACVEDPAADWAGPAYTTEIRFLEARTARLAAERWETHSAAAALTVSDDWFDQGLVHACYRLRGESLNRFRAAWDAAVDRVVRPKLLIVLDVPAGQPGGQNDAPEPGSDPAQLRRAILEHARQPGHGPTLWLPGHDRDQCLQEAVAAIEAMR